MGTVEYRRSSIRGLGGRRVIGDDWFRLVMPTGIIVEISLLLQRHANLPVGSLTDTSALKKPADY